jgi:hypothetical protein
LKPELLDRQLGNLWSATSDKVPSALSETFRQLQIYPVGLFIWDAPMTDHELFRVAIGIIIVLGLLGVWWEYRKGTRAPRA